MSDYSRQYTNRINNNSGWENYTSTATPLSAANLNKMDQAIQNIDNAAYNAINTKANQTTVNGCINSITFDSDTGVFTISFVNGTSITINTALEKVVTNFTYNSSTQSLVLTLADGSTQSISLAEFITQYEFEDTDTIGFTVTNGKVKAAIVDGSIGSDQMDPDYLTDCEEQVDTAKDYARQSQSYAVGNATDDEGNPYREGQSTDNAKHYCQQAQQAASESGAAPFIGATSTTGGVKGLVPAPLIADREKFLKGSGEWAEVNLEPFTGATSSAAGAKGMVPQPSAGQQNATLFGDGTWKTLLYDALMRYENGQGKIVPYDANRNIDLISQNGTCVALVDGDWAALRTYIDAGADSAIQIAYFFYASKVLIRRKGNGTWYEWKRVCTADEKSYVGMIIHSTTLNAEAKVKAQYGGTTWIQHSGYFLRGASSGVTANSAAKDGGQDSITPSGTNSGGSVSSHTLTINEMPSHGHSVAVERNFGGGNSGWSYSCVDRAATRANDYGKGSASNTGGGQGHSHGFTQPTFTGTAHTNLPSYKNVYIWERTA